MEKYDCRSHQNCSNRKNGDASSRAPAYVLETRITNITDHQKGKTQHGTRHYPVPRTKLTVIVMKENDEECEGSNKPGGHGNWNAPEGLQVLLRAKDRQTVEASETNRPTKQVNEGNRPTHARLRSLKAFRQLQIQKNRLRAQ